MTKVISSFFIFLFYSSFSFGTPVKSDSITTEQEFIDMRVKQILAMMKHNEAIKDISGRNYVMPSYTGPASLITNGALIGYKNYSDPQEGIKGKFSDYHKTEADEKKTHEYDINVDYLNEIFIDYNKELEQTIPSTKPFMIVGFDNFLWEIVTKKEIQDNTDWNLTDNNIFSKAEYDKAYEKYNDINEKIVSLVAAYSSRRVISIFYGSFSEINNKIEGNESQPYKKKWYWANYFDSQQDTTLHNNVFYKYSPGSQGATFDGAVYFGQRISLGLRGYLDYLKKCEDFFPAEATPGNSPIIAIKDPGQLNAHLKQFETGCFLKLSAAERIHCLTTLSKQGFWDLLTDNEVIALKIIKTVPLEQQLEFLTLFENTPKLFIKLTQPLSGVDLGNFDEMINYLAKYTYNVNPINNNLSMLLPYLTNKNKRFPFYSGFLESTTYKHEGENNTITFEKKIPGGHYLSKETFPPSGSYKLFEYVLVTFMDSFTGNGKSFKAGETAYVPGVLLYGLVNSLQARQTRTTIDATIIFVSIATLPFTAGTSSGALKLAYADLMVTAGDIAINDAAYDWLSTSPNGQKVITNWSYIALGFGVANLGYAGYNFFSRTSQLKQVDELLESIENVKPQSSGGVTTELSRVEANLKGVRSAIIAAEELWKTNFIKTLSNLSEFGPSLASKMRLDLVNPRLSDFFKNLSDADRLKYARHWKFAVNEIKNLESSTVSFAFRSPETLLLLEKFNSHINIKKLIAPLVEGKDAVLLTRLDDLPSSLYSKLDADILVVPSSPAKSLKKILRDNPEDIKAWEAISDLDGPTRLDDFNIETVSRHISETNKTAGQIKSEIALSGNYVEWLVDHFVTYIKNGFKLDKESIFRVCDVHLEKVEGVEKATSKGVIGGHNRTAFFGEVYDPVSAPNKRVTLYGPETETGVEGITEVQYMTYQSQNSPNEHLLVQPLTVNGSPPKSGLQIKTLYNPLIWPKEKVRRFGYLGFKKAIDTANDGGIGNNRSFQALIDGVLVSGNYLEKEKTIATWYFLKPKN